MFNLFGTKKAVKKSEFEIESDDDGKILEK